ncbi:hypothetical protein D9M71_752370 [compost metagenome]
MATNSNFGSIWLIEKASPLSCIRKIRERKREKNAVEMHNPTSTLIDLLSIEKRTLDIEIGVKKQKAKVSDSSNKPGNNVNFSRFDLLCVS